MGLLDLAHRPLAAALLGACVMGGISIWAKGREDTVISAIWGIGMATGILFISVTPGYAVDPMSYLFGDILADQPGRYKTDGRPQCGDTPDNRCILQTTAGCML